jgi:hypothetical protein
MAQYVSVGSFATDELCAHYTRHPQLLESLTEFASGTLQLRRGLASHRNAPPQVLVEMKRRTLRSCDRASVNFGHAKKKARSS